MNTNVSSLIHSAYAELPLQLQIAARWLLDNPDDVALLSMREQAKRASVSPATMVRLARRLGFESFDDLRALYAAAIRQRPAPFTARTSGLLARRDLDGDDAFLRRILDGFAGHAATLQSGAALPAITRAADIITQSERLFCIGVRSNFAGAHLGAYLLSLLGEEAVLVDAPGATGLDRLRGIGPRDAVLAVGIKPYARITIDAARFAREAGASVIAVTDSTVSPLATKTAACVVVPTGTPSFLQTVVPVVMVVECLAALVAARRGERAVEAMAKTEQHLARFDSYFHKKT